MIFSAITWDFNPEIFSIGNHGVRWYGLMIALFSARFLIEFVKNDQVAFEAGMSFNMGQLLSLPFILAGIGLIAWTKAKPR